VDRPAPDQKGHMLRLCWNSRRRGRWAPSSRCTWAKSRRKTHRSWWKPRP